MGHDHLCRRRQTDLLIAMWRAFGIDEMLREFQDREKIFCGMSAGTICWFASTGTAGPQDNTPRYGRVTGPRFRSRNVLAAH